MYHCLEPGCDHITKREHDLKRHSKAKHSETDKLLARGEMMDCPYSGCGHKGRHGFKRKDHLRDHCKRYHRRDLPKSMGGDGKKLNP